VVADLIRRRHGEGLSIVDVVRPPSATAAP
jgi:hypothetical protein